MSIAVRVLCPEISTVVQKILFSHGYVWSGTRIQEVSCTDREILHFNESHRTISHSDLKYVQQHKVDTISLEDFFDKFIEKPILIGGDVVEITKDKITVGCKTVDRETVIRIYNKMMEMK